MSDGEVAEALGILSDVCYWQLTPQRWDVVQQILDAITQAVGAGDTDSIWQAFAELELASPLR
jgi:hypothetical protein